MAQYLFHLELFWASFQIYVVSWGKGREGDDGVGWEGVEREGKVELIRGGSLLLEIHQIPLSLNTPFSSLAYNEFLY